MRLVEKFPLVQKGMIVSLVDFTLIGISFFAAVYIKNENVQLSSQYQVLLGIFFSVWLFTSLLAYKFRLKRPSCFLNGLRPIFRAFLYLAFLFLFLHFLFQMFFYSRFIILLTLLLFVSLEVLTYSIFFVLRLKPKIEVINGNGVALMEMGEKNQEEDVCIDKQGRDVGESLLEKLQDTLEGEHRKVFDFIDSTINLSGINASCSLVLDSKYTNTVHGIIKGEFEFIGNICLVNELSKINGFFSSVNRKLAPGGYFYSKGETFEQRLKRKYSKYPKYLKRFCRFVDFVWTRAFPKLPVLKNIYFTIRGTKYRVLSESEILGRLFFCGFRLVNSEDIENKRHFIVKKVRTPLRDRNPSYGPIFKQQRIGQDGELIYIYKLRTMYPYSEYVHKHLYDNNELSQSGKIRDDTRITSWGRKLRKYWIDELPMLINFLRGDLKLVGLRPLSLSFFSIYPADLKRQRMQFKPGLIPSLYADFTKSEEEIFASEQKYINRYREHPWKTDFSYFFKVLRNILFRGVRSG